MTEDEHQSAQIAALLEGQHQLAKQMAELVLTHRDVARRLDEGDARFERVERTIKDTAEAVGKVKEVVDTVAALKGGLKVLGWMGVAAKWVASIGVAGAILVAAIKFVLYQHPPK